LCGRGIHGVYLVLGVTETRRVWRAAIFRTVAHAARGATADEHVVQVGNLRHKTGNTAMSRECDFPALALRGDSGRIWEFGVFARCAELCYYSPVVPCGVRDVPIRFEPTSELRGLDLSNGNAIAARVTLV